MSNRIKKTLEANVLLERRYLNQRGVLTEEIEYSGQTDNNDNLWYTGQSGNGKYRIYVKLKGENEGKEPSSLNYPNIVKKYFIDYDTPENASKAINTLLTNLNSPDTITNNEPKIDVGLFVKDMWSQKTKQK